MNPDHLAQMVSDGKIGIEELVSKYPSAAVSVAMRKIRHAASHERTGPRRLCWEMVALAIVDASVRAPRGHKETESALTERERNYRSAWRFLRGEHRVALTMIEGLDLEPSWIIDVLRRVGIEEQPRERSRKQGACA